MKIKSIVIIALLVLAGTVWAIKLSPFNGWNSVKQKSSDIIIARCVKTVDAPNPSWGGLIDSDIQIVSVLKGRTNLIPARLYTTYWPRQGEYYLIFAISMDGGYNALETYRVVPLGIYVPPDLLTGKTLDENIKILFQRRLDNLNRQMKEEQEEKQRLEEGVKK